jgi:hypothetical protein
MMLRAALSSSDVTMFQRPAAGQWSSVLNLRASKYGLS